jgi:tRNA(Arg) A34 adenosine deaminase TadA
MASESVHEPFVREAIALAGQARHEGNHPFGALLVLDGKVVLRAKNSVFTDCDPTAHAETNLVAKAVRELQPGHIRRTALYTSCEPCAMCVGKMYWAGIRTVVYGLSNELLSSLAGPDFLIPCRELFRRAVEPVTVIGPLLEDEARSVHIEYWHT